MSGDVAGSRQQGAERVAGNPEFDRRLVPISRYDPVLAPHSRLPEDALTTPDLVPRRRRGRREAVRMEAATATGRVCSRRGRLRGTPSPWNHTFGHTTASLKARIRTNTSRNRRNREYGIQDASPAVVRYAHRRSSCSWTAMMRNASLTQERVCAICSRSISRLVPRDHGHTIEAPLLTS